MDSDTKRLAALADETPLREGLARMGLAGAAEEIDRLRAENVALREALSVFADERSWRDITDGGADPWDGRLFAAWVLEGEPFEFARAALAHQTEGEG